MCHQCHSSTRSRIQASNRPPPAFCKHWILLTTFLTTRQQWHFRLPTSSIEQGSNTKGQILLEKHIRPHHYRLFGLKKDFKEHCLEVKAPLGQAVSHPQPCDILRTAQCNRQGFGQRHVKPKSNSASTRNWGKIGGQASSEDTAPFSNAKSGA